MVEGSDLINQCLVVCYVSDWDILGIRVVDCVKLPLVSNSQLQLEMLKVRLL